MGGSSDDVVLSIGAELKGLVSGLAQATGHVKAATETMQGHFTGLARAVDNLKAPLLAIGGALSGGALFKHAIAEAIDFQLAVGKLARQMGSSTQDASVFRMAMERVGVPVDVAGKAAALLARRIAEGGSSLTAIGVNARDSSGHLKPMSDIIMEVNARLLEFKEGTDRNAAGVKVYGRGWSEVAGILRVTPEVMAKAAEEAKRLHLLVGPEGVAAARKYKLAMHEIEEVGLSLKVQLANQLIPVLTQVGESMAEAGPDISDGFGVAMKVVISMVEGVIASFKTLVSIVMGVGQVVIAGGAAAWKGLAYGMTGQFDKAKQSVLQGWDEIKFSASTTAGYIAETWGEANKRANALWQKKPESARSKVKEGLDYNTDKEETGKQLVEDWRRALEEKKDLEQNWFRESLADDIAYWKSKRAQAAEHSASAAQAVDAIVRKLRKDQARQALADDVAALKEQQQEARDDGAQRIELARQVYARLLAAYKSEYAAPVLQAMRELKQVEREVARENAEADRMVLEKSAQAHMKSLDAEAQLVKERRQAGEISRSEELAEILQLERERYDTKRKSLQDIAGLENLSKKQKSAALAEMETEEKEYARRVGALNREAARERTAEVKSIVRPYAQAFGQAFSSIVTGMQSFGDAMKTLWQSLISTLIDQIVALGVEWVTTQVASMIFGKAAAAGKISAEAGVVGAEVAAQTALIPVVGPAMAVPAGEAAALATLGAFMPYAMAARGFDIPAGLNPLTQLHQREMVLPAQIADPLRDAIGAGSLGRAGSRGGLTANFYGVTDARTFWRQNEREILRTMKRAARTGAGR